MHPDLGNLLLELKDLGLVARTDFEELLTNLSRMEVLMYRASHTTHTFTGGMQVFAGILFPLPFFLFCHTRSYNILP